MIDWELYQILRLEKFFPAPSIELPERGSGFQQEEALCDQLGQRPLARELPRNCLAC